MTRKDDGFSQLAVLKCLVDEGTAALKAGGWGIRDAADEYMEDRWEADGTDRHRIYVAGEEVGTITARVSKRRVVREPRVLKGGEDDLCDWLMDPDNEDGRRALRSLVLSDVKKALRYATVDGVLPDGVEVVERVEPGGRFEGTTLRVDPDKVREALGCATVIEALIGAPRLLDGGDGR